MPPTLISEDTKVKVKGYLWLVGIVIYGTAWCVKIDMDVKSDVTEKQFASWIFQEEMANRDAYPRFVWAPMPEKLPDNSFVNLLALKPDDMDPKK